MIESYIIIYILLFTIFIAIGNKTDANTYWKTVSILIIAFTFTEGLRYMRGIDYYHYALQYDNPFLRWFDEDIGFDMLNNLLRFLQLNSIGAFCVYAFITIWSICFFLKEFPEIWKCVFFVFLASSIRESEWMIRQFISISIMYAALVFLLKKDYLWFCVVASISVLLHYSSVFFLVAILSVYLLKEPIPLKISIPLFIVFAMLLKADFWLPYIGDFINQLTVSDDVTYSEYIKKDDMFLNANATRKEMMRSGFTTFLNYIFYLVVYIEGYYLFKKLKSEKYTFIYNLFIVGSIIFECFLTFELFRRIALPMYLLWFVLVSYMFCHPQKMKIDLCLIILWGFVMVHVFRFIFFPEEGLFLFVWDM